MDWRRSIENTGEVSASAVSQSLNLDLYQVLDFANHEGHGSRYVGGTSHSLIWKEDAEEIERRTKGVGSNLYS